jgi:hypothetical protein
MVTTDITGKPFQLSFIRPSQMTMFANLFCDPPLGQPTVISHGQNHVCYEGRSFYLI